MKKYFTIATIAAAALAVAACQPADQNVNVPVDETAAAQVELNEDGSVATENAVERIDREVAPRNPDEKIK